MWAKNRNETYNTNEYGWMSGKEGSKYKRVKELKC